MVPLTEWDEWGSIIWPCPDNTFVCVTADMWHLDMQPIGRYIDRLKRSSCSFMTPWDQHKPNCDSLRHVWAAAVAVSLLCPRSKEDGIVCGGSVSCATNAEGLQQSTSLAHQTPPSALSCRSLAVTEPGMLAAAAVRAAPIAFRRCSYSRPIPPPMWQHSLLLVEQQVGHGVQHLHQT